MAADGAALRDLAADCAAYPDSVRAVLLPAVGTMMTDAVTARRARLSRYNRGAGATLTGAATVAADTVRLTPKPLGPWTIAESGSNRARWTEGARPHKGRGGPKRIAMASGDVRWYVRHGPVRGRQVWSDVLTVIGDELPATVHTAAVEAWDRVR